MGAEMYPAPHNRRDWEERDGIRLAPTSELLFTRQEDMDRRAGILVPVAAIRQKADIGIGNTYGMRDTIRFAAKHNLGLIEVLPQNEMDGNNSPYLPISATALEPMLIDPRPETTPGLTRDHYDKFLIKRFTEERKNSNLIDYNETRALSYRLHFDAFKNFCRTEIPTGSSRAREFKEFRDKAHDSWLGDYTVFRSLIDIQYQNSDWRSWPENLRDRAKAQRFFDSSDECKFLADFYAYRQWIAYRDWREVKEMASEYNVRLAGDLSWGVAVNSADVWAHPELFIMNLSVGAPPEPWFQGDEYKRQRGQNWGFRVYNMQAHIDEDFKWFRSRVANLLEYNHDIRFDHARGPFQTYAVPWEPQQNHNYLDISEEETKRRTGGRLPSYIPDPGHSRYQNQFNADLGKLFFSNLISECQKQDARIFAEDGGAGRFEYIHESLGELNIPGMVFIGTEKKWDSEEFIDPATQPKEMVLYFRNHDHPSLRDNIERLVENRHTPEGKRELSEFLKLAGRDPSSDLEKFEPSLQTELIDQVLKSPANTVIFNALDILLKNGSLNDWRFRLEKPLYKYEQNQEVAALLDHISVRVVIYKRI